MSNDVVSCLLCGGDLNLVFDGVWDDRFGTPGRYDIARCRRCSTEQTIPRPSVETLQAFYERYYNFGGSEESRGTSTAPDLYVRLRQWFYGSIFYRFWLAIDGDVSFHAVSAAKGTKAAKLLDIGCNEGRGLVRFRARGFDAEGLELNRVAAAAARELGFTVHTVQLSELPCDRSFDVVVLSNVLEHTLDPRLMLRDSRRILKDDGEIWISAPNGTSFLRSLFGRHWINWHVPYHIVHFTKQTVGKLLSEEGFSIQSVSYATPALWVAQPIITTLYARPDRPTKQLRSFVLVGGLALFIRFLFFPILWFANRTGRGDCLLVRARRLR